MRTLRLIYRFLRDVYTEFAQDNGSLVATAMAFFGLLSLVPLLLLAIGVLGYVIGSERAFLEVEGLLRDYFPVGTEELRENLDAIRRTSGVVSGIGLLGLLWTGSNIFVILQQAMNIALDVKDKLSFWKVRARAIVIVVVAGFLFALSIGITWFITAIRAYDIQVWGITTNKLDPLLDVLTTLIPLIISLVMFFLIYKYLPTIDMGFTGPLIAGVSAGLLFELAKWVFGWYATNFGNFTAVYGSIGGVIVLILWIYYVSTITVVGAEVASVYRKHERGGEQGGSSGG